MNNYLEQAKEIEQEIRNWRRRIHQNPEIGIDLPETTTFIMNTLKSFGLEPEEISKSGVMCLIKGKEAGKTFLLRADSDALPMTEKSNVLFKSQKLDMAHTCGHDMHTAMLLGAAKLLSENQENFKGTVKLMFQPGEEILQGAKDMIEAGILENPKVDAAMGLHVMPDGPPGGVGFALGATTMSSDQFEIEITGKGCHAAMPHLGVDPINVAAHIYFGYQSLIAREKPTGETAVLSICQIISGTTHNIVPETAIIQGSLRTFNEEVRMQLRRRLIQVAEQTAEMFQETANLKWKNGCPSINSDPTLVKELVGYITDLKGDFYQIPDYKVPASEDFSFISEQVPSAYFLLSAKIEGNDYPLHSPFVELNEDVLPIGTAIHAQCATEWLNNNE